MPIKSRILFGLALLGAVACRQIVGISDQSCGSCSQQHCGAEREACSGVPACAALENCLTACNGEPGCRSQCTIDNPVGDGADIPAALDACLASNCSAICGLTCGALSKVAAPAAASACASCIESYACAEAQTCAGSAYCQREFLCRENCVTGDCTGRCSLPGYDGGEQLCPGTCGASPCLTNCSGTPDANMSLYSTFMGTVSGRCQKDCAVGNNWSCVGNVEWPAAKGPERALTLALRNIDGSPNPVNDVTVKMCGATDLNCETIIDEQMTDAYGVVRLVDNTPVVNGIGLNGYLDLSAPDIYPMTIQWGFPLSETEGILSTPAPVFYSGAFLGLFAQHNVTIDPEMGHIGVVAVDCLGNQSPGVRFSVSGLGSEAQLLYVPSISGDGPTDESGTAFFINVPPGNYDVSAIPDSLGAVSSHQHVAVRAGSLSAVGMAPTPSP
jgi:hypothetical protein